MVLVGALDADPRDRIVEAMLLRQVRRRESVIAADHTRVHGDLIGTVITSGVEAFATTGEAVQRACIGDTDVTCRRETDVREVEGVASGTGHSGRTFRVRRVVLSTRRNRP